MKVFNFIGTKGGVGTSTTAAMFALSVAANANKVLFVDATGTKDAHAIFGVVYGVRDSVQQINPSLDIICDTRVATLPQDYEVVVVDYGRKPAGGPASIHGKIIMVVRNDYLALRNAMGVLSDADAVVAILEPGRALSEQDVCAVCNYDDVPVVSLPYDPVIARAVDAGLMCSRYQHGSAAMQDLSEALFVYA